MLGIAREIMHPNTGPDPFSINAKVNILHLQIYRVNEVNLFLTCFRGAEVRLYFNNGT